MCLDPISMMVISTALSAGGEYINQNEASANAAREAEARNRELRRTQARQRQYAADSQAQLAKQIGRVAEGETGREQLQDDLTADFQAQVVAPEDVAPVVSSADAPKIVQSEFAKKLRESLDKGKQRAASSARLGSFGQQLFGNALGAQDVGRFVDTRNRFSSADMSLLPHMQDFAAIEARKPSSGIGNIMKATGSVLGMGAGAPGVPAKTPASVDPWLGLRTITSG